MSSSNYQMKPVVRLPLRSTSGYVKSTPHKSLTNRDKTQGLPAGSAYSITAIMDIELQNGRRLSTLDPKVRAIVQFSNSNLGRSTK
jgi:hypothetical protein